MCDHMISRINSTSIRSYHMVGNFWREIFLDQLFLNDIIHLDQNGSLSENLFLKGLLTVNFTF